MTSDTFIQQAAYNQWINQRLYEACATLDDSARKSDRGAFFKSIHGTLNHILVGDRIWMGRFLGEPAPVRDLDRELYAEFPALTQARNNEDERICDWAASLTGERLSSTLRYESIVEAQTVTCPYWIAAVHFFNHQIHHRGQLCTLLTQAGVDYGVTDLIAIPGILSRESP